MRKLFVALLAFVLAMGVLPACDSDKPVTITVVSMFYENSAADKDYNRDNFVNAYTAFEQSTGHTVKDVSTKSGETWKKKVNDDFKNGSDPDVLYFFTGADAEEFVKAGKVVPIRDIQRSYPDYAANMRSALLPVTAGDKYAVPVSGYWEGLYVNKKVLTECGVDFPGANYTWEQFLLDCAKIKGAGKIPISCALGMYPHYIFEYFTFNNGDMGNHLTLPAAENDAAFDKWTAGLEDIKELYEAGYFHEDALAADDDDKATEIDLLMTQNEAAFMIDGSWKASFFQNNAEDIEDFMVTFVPSKGEGRKTTELIGGLSMGYYITKKAWNDRAKRKACVDFVMHMTSDEVVTSFGALSITALKGGIKPPDNPDALVTSILKMTNDYTGVMEAVQDLLDRDKRTELFAAIKDILAGSMSAEDAVRKVL